MLKPPEQLSFEEVDRLIDETVYFTVQDWGRDKIRYSAFPVDEDAYEGNYRRNLFDLFDDVEISEKENDEGYVDGDCINGDCFIWKAEPLTEKQIDSLLGLDFLWPMVRARLGLDD